MEYVAISANRRLIDPKNTGARNIEVMYGTLQPGHGALPRAHPGIEQVCYLLEGSAVAEVAPSRGGTTPPMRPRLPGFVERAQIPDDLARLLWGK